MSKFVTCTTQAEVDKAIKAGNVPVVKQGFIEVTSGSVRAYGSASVYAYDSASVRAYGSASVYAYGSASVHATPFVAVQQHGNGPNVNGGVLIQFPHTKTVKDWLEFYGIKPARGSVTLYKAVDQEFKSGHGADYTPGTQTTCDDWDAGGFCGSGLHFSPRPMLADRYCHLEKPRYVACKVKVSDIVLIDVEHGTPDKCKAPACSCLHEVDVDGEPVQMHGEGS